MSEFSTVDQAGAPVRLIEYLDASANWLAAMKQYVAVAAARAASGGRILDLGCGVGHDLQLLAGLGLVPVGVDASGVMVTEARRRLSAAGTAASVIQADAARLPFRPAAFDGCRIERVLQHVEDPRSVLTEVGRVVRPGGFLGVFEPDWTALAFGAAGPHDDAVIELAGRARHPAIGRQLPDLVESCGFVVLDVVTELSFADRLGQLPINIRRVLARAVDEGRLPAPEAVDWLNRQLAREAAGTFRASWPKILVVAHRAGATPTAHRRGLAGEIVPDGPRPDAVVMTPTPTSSNARCPSALSRSDPVRPQ